MWGQVSHYTYIFFQMDLHLHFILLVVFLVSITAYIEALKKLLFPLPEVKSNIAKTISGCNEKVNILVSPFVYICGCVFVCVCFERVN